METKRRFSLPFLHATPVDRVERAMRELERQGSGMARVAHAVASLMVVLFSLGSLVALSGDAFGAIVVAVEHGGLPGIPQAISILVSTLMVVCCDVGLVYAAMTIRVLRIRDAGRHEQVLHWVVLIAVAAIEAGTYLYMSVRYEPPTNAATWAIVVARAVMAPLLSVYLSMARSHPITPRDILHQVELAQGIQLVRDVLQVAQDAEATLADKMRLYGASAHMTDADRTRLDAMIAVVKDRIAPIAPADPVASLSSSLPVPLDGLVMLEPDEPEDAEDLGEPLPPMPMQRYSAPRLNERIEATR